MQAVILAAGEGTRMRPLTLTRPKPLVEVAGVPLITHVVRALPKEITELIIVVGYRAEQIKEHCKDEFLGRSVCYVQQGTIKGTGAALVAAREYLTGRFLVVSADDLIHTKGVQAALRFELSVVAYEHPEPERFGVISHTDADVLLGIDEKPEFPMSRLINTATMVLSTDIFKYQVPPAQNGEMQLTDMLAALAQVRRVMVVRTPFWLPVGKPDDIPLAEAALQEQARFTFQFFRSIVTGARRVALVFLKVLRTTRAFRVHSRRGDSFVANT